MASKRYAFVDRRRCVSCGACQNECPKGAVSVWRGCYAVVRTDNCVGCAKCEKVCPSCAISMKSMEDAE